MGREQASSWGADHAVMRGLNRSLVLDLLKQRSPISRAAIAKETRLAKPTVSAIVDDLLAQGAAIEIGVAQPAAGGGRPPILLEFNRRSQFYVGVQIGVRRTRVVVTDGRGEELARAEAPTSTAPPDSLLTAVGGVVTDLLVSAAAPPDAIAAVGVCLPGLVDPVAGVCLLAPNLGWSDVAVADVLGQAVGGAPVFVANTTQACTVAETVEGAADGADDVVLVYAGTGVGAGLILAGRLHHGHRGVAGEIGHLPVEGATEPCSCGRTGCLETLASAPALMRQATAAGLGAIDVPELAERADAGDDVAAGLLAAAGRRLGEAVGGLLNAVNPEVVVIGGGLADAGPALLDPLRAAATATALAPASEGTAIVPWALGQEAKIRGAVLVAMQNAEPIYRVMFRA